MPTLPVEPDFGALVRALRARGWTYARIAVAVELQGATISVWGVRDLAIGHTRMPSYAVGAALLNVCEQTHTPGQEAGA
jgi:hypothetical protein